MHPVADRLCRRLGRTAGAGTTPGRVWVVGGDGNPVAVPLTLGLTDGAMTEVRQGDLKEGQELIVGLAGAGVVTGLIALKAQRDHRMWCEARTRVDGTVSRIAKRRRYGLSEDAGGIDTGNVDRLVPIVRFRAANNVEYEIEAPEAPMEVGAIVAVAYDPAQPSGGRGVARAPSATACSVSSISARIRRARSR